MQTVETSLLALGDAERVAPVAAELRAGGFDVTVASTLSELRELLATGFCPGLLLVDARLAVPWRADALRRMVTLACSAPVPTLSIGRLHGLSGGAWDGVRELPADATVATIVKAVRALHDGSPPPGHPRATSQHDQVDA